MLPVAMRQFRLLFGVPLPPCHLLTSTKKEEEEEKEQKSGPGQRLLKAGKGVAKNAVSGLASKAGALLPAKVVAGAEVVVVAGAAVEGSSDREAAKVAKVVGAKALTPVTN